MSDVDDLMWRVHHALAGSPYTFVRTPQGFDVLLDLRGAGFWGDSMTSLRESWVHHVELDAAKRRFRILDELREVRWHARVGHFGASLGVQKGWVYVRSVGVDATGATWSFDSHEGRRVVAAAAKDAGWTERLNKYAMLGLVVAVASVAFGVLVTILALVLAP